MANLSQLNPEAVWTLSKVREEVNKEIASCREKSEPLIRDGSFLLFGVDYSLKGKTLGQARWATETSIALLRVNVEVAKVLKEKYTPVVTHEFCHLLAFHLSKTDTHHPLVRQGSGHGHGRVWKEIMGYMGQPADRLFSDSAALNKLGLAQATGETYPYGCKCMDIKFWFSKRRHNAVLKGKVYTCPDCRGNLKQTKVL